MAIELIAYAVVAAGLIIWLRNVLGTRHGEERERPNPLILPPDPTARRAQEQQPVLKAEGGAAARIAELAAKPTKIMSIGGKAAENGLLEIAEADKGFDVKFFLEGAQEAFVMIVEAFARGDRETLKDLLSDSIYRVFDANIAEREKRGETMTAEIRSINKAEISEARLSDRAAFISVRFRADEISATKDASGAVISGSMERVSELKDIWTFTRDIRSRDPRWLMCETRDDPDDGGAAPSR